MVPIIAACESGGGCDCILIGQCVVKPRAQGGGERETNTQAAALCPVHCPFMHTVHVNLTSLPTTSRPSQAKMPRAKRLLAFPSRPDIDELLMARVEE